MSRILAPRRERRAGSATSRFRELDDVSEPFFEMFRIVGLEPLDTDECGACGKS